MMFCCVGLAFASGQAPQASAQQLGEQSQHAASEAPQTQDMRRGTDESPLVVKNYPPETAQSAADVQEDRREKADTDAWTIRIGIVSIIIGALTILILVVQACVFVWQGKQLRKTVDAMQTEYAATHRPKIRVRRIDQVNPTVGQQIVAKVQASNVGESDAKIVRFGLDIFFRPPPGAPETFNAVPRDIAPVTVNAGMEAIVEVKCRIPTQSEIAQFQANAV